MAIATTGTTDAGRATVTFAEDLAGFIDFDEADYEAWLYEIHHSRKKDAPSGTLLLGRRTYDIFAAYWPYVGGEAMTAAGGSVMNGPSTRYRR